MFGPLFKAHPSYYFSSDFNELHFMLCREWRKPGQHQSQLSTLISFNHLCKFHVYLLKATWTEHQSRIKHWHNFINTTFPISYDFKESLWAGSELTAQHSTKHESEVPYASFDWASWDRNRESLISFITFVTFTCNMNEEFKYFVCLYEVT